MFEFENNQVIKKVAEHNIMCFMFVDRRNQEPFDQSKYNINFGIGNKIPEIPIFPFSKNHKMITYDGYITMIPGSFEVTIDLDTNTYLFKVLNENNKEGYIHREKIFEHYMSRYVSNFKKINYMKSLYLKKFMIPEGTVYYENIANGEYCSEKIRLVSNEIINNFNRYTNPEYFRDIIEAEKKVQEIKSNNELREIISSISENYEIKDKKTGKIIICSDDIDEKFDKETIEFYQKITDLFLGVDQRPKLFYQKPNKEHDPKYDILNYPYGLYEQ